jgi:Protein of unknown function (DUF3105)
MRRGASLALAAAVVPVLAVVVTVALGIGRGDSPVCEVERYPEQEGAHAAAPPPGHEYNSFPPTSGPSSDTPLVWDAYEEPVSQFRVLHNLLHGGVAVQYGARVPEETVERLRAWYEADPDGLVLAPLPALDRRVVLSAWTRLASCESFEERRFTSFRALHRFNGPERPARESMRRGRGGVPNPLGLRVSPAPVRDRAAISFVYPEAATVELEIRRNTVTGPLVRRLASVSLLPTRTVSLEWDVRDEEEQPLTPGTYVAVARLVGEPRPVSASTAFDVR